MPLRGVGHSRLVGDEAPYFVSLTELDMWFTQPRRKLTGVLPYQPRPHIEGQSGDRGKLLVTNNNSLSRRCVLRYSSIKGLSRL